MAKNEKETKKSSYFKEMKAELKKVVWPTPKELFNNTVAVIAFVLIIAVIVFVFDLCFDNLNKYGITTLQEKVQSVFKVEEENSSEENSSEENAEGDENTTSEEGNTTDAEGTTEANVVFENVTTEQTSEDSNTAEENVQTDNQAEDETVPEE